MKRLLVVMAALALLAPFNVHAWNVCFSQECVAARDAASKASAPPVASVTVQPSSSSPAAAEREAAAEEPHMLFHDAQSKLIADLTQALADNDKATDARKVLRRACWQTLLDLANAAMLPLPPSFTTRSAGIFDTIERAGQVAEMIETVADSQIPDDVRIKIEVGCGPVAMRARDILLRWNVRFVRLGARIALLAK